MGNSQLYSSESDTYESIQFDQRCNIDDFGHDFDCSIMTQSHAEGHLCSAGNCVIDGEDLSSIYFTCSDTVDVVDPLECWDGTGTTSTMGTTTTTTEKSTTITIRDRHAVHVQPGNRDAFISHRRTG